MKKTQPYLPLYVQDVLTDPNLCACSAAACGVFLYILCVLHKQPEYGVYRLWEDADKGDLFSVLAKQLSRQTPLSADEIEPALRELVSRHVLTLGEDCIFEENMVWQNTLREKRASAGQKGGSKTQSKQKNFACTFALAKSEAKYENEIENEIDIEYEIIWIEGV